MKLSQTPVGHWKKRRLSAAQLESSRAPMEPKDEAKTEGGETVINTVAMKTRDAAHIQAEMASYFVASVYERWGSDMLIHVSGAGDHNRITCVVEDPRKKSSVRIICRAQRDANSGDYQAVVSIVHRQPQHHPPSKATAA